MATRRITVETAQRTLRLIQHFNGDLAVARHDIRIGLDSLGGYYTDRKSEAVYDLLTWLINRPTRQAELLTQLTTIASGERS